jgi:tetratricopeptide (TPR) repeat protein
MKFLPLICIAVTLLNTKTCNFKINTPPKLSAKEEELIKALKDTFQAESVTVMRAEEGNSIVQRSLQITLLNCKIINLNDPQLEYYGNLIADNLLAKNNYEKKYDEIEIVFEQKTGNWFYNNKKSHSFIFNEPQMDAIIERHLDPIIILSRRIKILKEKELYNDIILLGDSLTGLDSTYREFGEQAKGIGYLYLKDSIQALKYFRLAAKIDPGNATNYENLALVYSGMKNYKLALANIDSAIAILPEKGELYYLRGKYQHETGKDSLACKDIEKAEALGFSGAAALALTYCN